ncbi:hypothetical protein MCG98_18290 [Ruminococcus sp. OA3]|uniref:hypothetical protein n=1 Tax=Ruminococcus sp. OA3 TaxID=2914164 RepID=UPI001F05601E|nr:hypothetical protein [Ruminococcus sp. OA3]MCH1984506.1 hypothetical protein [Ruminococcus sp. OA3]
MEDKAMIMEFDKCVGDILLEFKNIENISGHYDGDIELLWTKQGNFLSVLCC